MSQEEYIYSKREEIKSHFARRTVDQQAGFLLRHLRQGMTLIDCGCGPGSITHGLARIVGSAKVWGVDVDMQSLQKGRSSAAESGAFFANANIFSLPFAANVFDVAYSNAVLSHLSDPLAALLEIRRVLKPGGILAVRVPDFDGRLIVPQDDRLIRSLQAHVAEVRKRGGNPTLGKHLRSFALQAGFVNVEAAAEYESFGTPDAVRYWGNVVSTGLLESLAEKGSEAEREECKGRAVAWREWAEGEDSFLASAWCTVLGWKA